MEELLYSQKMKPAKENLLKPTDEEASKGFQIDTQKFEPKIDLFDEDEDEEGGIANKAKQYDVLAEFADMENAALDFESWEAKKLKIFAQF